MKEHPTETSQKGAPPRRGINGLAELRLGLKEELEHVEKSLDRFRRTELQEFTTYLKSPWRIIWANFLAGTARGLGFLLGAALVITLAGLILSKVLSHIPVVGDFFQAVNIWIQGALQSSHK